MPHPTRRALLAVTGTALAGRLARAADNPLPPPAPAAIGAAVPLSGSLAIIGDECQRGIALAVAAVNEAGGIAGQPVNLTLADTRDQEHAADAVNFLIGAGHAGVILSAGASDVSYPASAAAELAQVPFIELNAPAAGLTARGFKFLLRTGPTTDMIAALAVSTIQARFPGRKIGLLFNTGATGGAIAGAAIRALKAASIPPLLIIGYGTDEADLTEPAGRLMRARADIVLHAAGAQDTLAFFAALRGAGWRPEAVLGCGDGYGLRENAEALGPAFEGTLMIGAPFYPPAAAGIEQAYWDSYGMAPRAPDSLTAYVGAKLVLDALAAGQGDPGKSLDAIRRSDVPAGGLANGFGAAFDRTGQNTRSFVTLQQWSGQQPRPV
jgi:branched-chain amino acid transport system substrate-binding protein